RGDGAAARGGSARGYVAAGAPRDQGGSDGSAAIWIVLTPCPPLRSGEGGRQEFPLSRRERGSGGEDRERRSGQGVRTRKDATLVDRLLQNIRLGTRSLSRAPGFVLTAVLTLALGIGLATAVFTVADALLLRRLPVRDQDRLVVLWGRKPDREFAYPLGLDDAREFARQTRSLERVAFFSYYGAGPKPIRDGDQISLLRRALVSGEFFDVLGARPVLGRALGATDDVSGAAPVLVL